MWTAPEKPRKIKPETIHCVCRDEGQRLRESRRQSPLKRSASRRHCQMRAGRRCVQSCLSPNCTTEETKKAQWGGRARLGSEEGRGQQLRPVDWHLDQTTSASSLGRLSLGRRTARVTRRTSQPWPLEEYYRPASVEGGVPSAEDRI